MSDDKASTQLDEGKVSEFKKKFNELLHELLDNNADHAAEIDEALRQFIKDEFGADVSRNDEDDDTEDGDFSDEDPGDPEGSGFNKGP